MVRYSQSVVHILTSVLCKMAIKEYMYKISVCNGAQWKIANMYGPVGKLNYDLRIILYPYLKLVSKY